MPPREISSTRRYFVAPKSGSFVTRSRCFRFLSESHFNSFPLPAGRAPRCETLLQLRLARAALPARFCETHGAPPLNNSSPPPSSSHTASPTAHTISPPPSHPRSDRKARTV